MKVKICGITNLEDALIAAYLGADALGFVFVKESPRSITPDAARDIISKLPPFIVTTGVFVNSPEEEILSIIKQTRIQCVQLHGNESPAEYSKIKVPVIKAFHVDEHFIVNTIVRYPATAYLLDTYVKGKAGGTGKTFDWDIAVRAQAYGRIILAGGLTPENIGDAIRKVQPYAIDISSGIESSPGKKDKRKLQELFTVLHYLEREKSNMKEKVND
ncbi:MAG: phosphoribosylanthranilate isomerase [Ignavibacteriaceae bacterium]|nr:phosphoribosylanthranilate isomerase [Ignavibacteriaceae bacterium]